MGLRTKRLALATLFGVVVFLSDVVLPSPLKYMFFVVHATLLCLGAIILRRMGATYVALIGGSLAAVWQFATAPFTFAFAVLYGLLVDGLIVVFKVIEDDYVMRRRLIAASAVGTVVVGGASFYTTVIVFGWFPRNVFIETAILVGGTLNGAVAGYLASLVWNKYLKDLAL
jgi:hypothetical protein